MTNAPGSRDEGATTARERRRFLGVLAGTALGALAGCVANFGAGDATGDPTTGGPTGGSTTGDPTTDGDRTPAPGDGGAYPNYGEDVARVVPYEAVDPSTEPVYLEPLTDRIRLPEGELGFTLHNGGDRTYATNFYDWRIHRWEDGWHHVVPVGHPDPLMTVEPGESHTWRVTVDNTDLGTVGDGPSGTEEVTVEGLGAGTYAFATFGWFEDPGGEGTEPTPGPGADHEHKLAPATHFTLEGDPLPLPPSDRVAGANREGDTVTVTVDGPDPGSEGVREATFVLSRAPDAADPRVVVTEQAIREWPLRDALAHVEPGVETVRVETTTSSVPAFAGHRRDSPLRYDGETFRIHVEDSRESEG